MAEYRVMPVSRSIVHDHVVGLVGRAIAESASSGGDYKDQSTLLEDARSFAIDLSEARLEGVMTRVVVWDFHRFREGMGLPADVDSSKAWDAYVGGAGPRYLDRWFQIFPLLPRLVTAVVVGSAEHAMEICRRLVADTDILRSRFGLLPSETIAFADLGGDPHRGGRAAAVLAGRESRVIYKPRPVSPEEMMGHLFTKYGDLLAFDMSGMVPAGVDRGEYGWQDVVEAAPAHSIQECCDYYYRAGAASALFAAIGTSDIHHENVIAHRDRPVFVDLETALRADCGTSYFDVPTALRDDAGYSISATLMLPHRPMGGPYSVLMSGLGVPFSQTSTRTDFLPVMYGTDAYDIRKERWEMEHEENVLHGPDGPVNILDHEEDFAQGYREGYSVIRRDHESLCREVERRATYRTVFRSTAVYARFMQALWEPSRLKDPSEMKRTLGLMGMPNSLPTRVADKQIFQSEAAELSNGDVPYFVTASDSTWAQGVLGDLPSVFDLSPIERAECGLRSLGDGALLREELTIDRSFAEVRALVDSGRHATGAAVTVFDRMASKGELTSDSIADAINLLAIKSQRGVGWLSGGSPEVFGTFNSAPAVSLHDYGIHIPLRRRATSSLGDDAMSDRASAAEAGYLQLARKYRSSLVGSPFSLISGPQSVGYSLLMSPDGLRLFLESVSCSDLSPDGDFVVGSGATLVAMNAVAALDGSEAKRMAGSQSRLSEGLPEELGIAHGRLGIYWMNWVLAEVAEDPSGSASAGQSIDAAVSAILGRADSSWCNGHAGAAIVAVACGRLGQQTGNGLLERMSVLPPGPVDISVCHGLAGRLQAMVRLHHAGFESALSAAVELRDRAVRQIAHFGYFTGSAEHRSMLGYFLGWSGLLDALLLVDLADEPCSRWIPIAMDTAGAVEELA